MLLRSRTASRSSRRGDLAHLSLSIGASVLWPGELYAINVDDVCVSER
jgi:hypothetical protein